VCRAPGSLTGGAPLKNVNSIGGMSPFGTKLTWRPYGGMSGVEGQADVGWASADVAF
jgi:hypothetical protein